MTKSFVFWQFKFWDLLWDAPGINDMASAGESNIGLFWVILTYLCENQKKAVEG